MRRSFCARILGNLERFSPPPDNMLRKSFQFISSEQEVNHGIMAQMSCESKREDEFNDTET